MKILFVLLSIPESRPSESNGLYIDLAKKCKALGHDVSIIASSLIETRFASEDGIKILRVKAKRIVGEPNLIKKGIAMATLPMYFKKEYYKYMADEKFDWIVMPTPPITLIDFVATIKKKLKCKLYLILRDIHPQSSWSLGEIKYKWMYNYLDKRSWKGYKIADRIGCMSQGNIDYILREYPKLESSKMRVLYNWLEPPRQIESASDIRVKYNLQDKIIALFGGNIALGQRIENLVDLADHYRDSDFIRFVVIGKGVKKQELIDSINQKGLNNVIFLDYMPQNDYLNFVRNVDIGLISINENNAAPTCPSKLVSYMSMKVPVLAMINSNNDYGNMIDEANAGFWTVGSDKEKVYQYFEELVASPELRKIMGKSAFDYYTSNLTTEVAAKTITSQMD